MRFPVTLFVLLALFCPPLMATDAVETPSVTCLQWLDASLFGRLRGNKAAEERAKTNKKAIVKELRKALQEFSLSTFRNDSGAYDTLLKYLKDLQGRIGGDLLKARTNLATQKIAYERNYSLLGRMIPGGADAVFWREKVKPLINDVAVLESLQETLKEMMKEATDAKVSMAKEGLLREAKILFALAFEEHDEDTSANFARALLGYKGDLNERLETTTETYNKLMEDYDDDVATGLTGALMNKGATDDASIKQIKAIFEKLNEHYDENVSIGLTTIAFGLGYEPDNLKRIRYIFDMANNELEVGETDLLPIVGYFARSKTNPTKESLKALEKLRDKIYEHDEVGDSESTMILGLLLSTKGENFKDSDLQVVLDLFDHFYKVDNVGSTEAAILAAAVFIVNPNSAAIKTEAVAIWKDLFAQDSISSQTAAGLTLKILISRHGVADSLLAEGIANAADLQEAVSSSTSSILDPMQFAITGSLINLDHNPFTKI